MTTTCPTMLTATSTGVNVGTPLIHVKCQLPSTHTGPHTGMGVTWTQEHPH